MFITLYNLLMLTETDYIVSITPRKTPRFKGEVVTRKTYRCTCDNCGVDRGYQTKSRYKNKPLCIKCATNTEFHKNILKRNHWSKTGVYTPTKNTIEETKQQKQKAHARRKEWFPVWYANNREKLNETKRKRMT